MKFHDNQTAIIGKQTKRKREAKCKKIKQRKWLPYPRGLPKKIAKQDFLGRGAATKRTLFWGLPENVGAAFAATKYSPLYFALQSVGSARLNND